MFKIDDMVFNWAEYAEALEVMLFTMVSILVASIAI